MSLIVKAARWIWNFITKPKFRDTWFVAVALAALMPKTTKRAF